MMRSLFAKTLYDRRWFLLGWTLGIAVLCWVTILFYPSFAKTNTLDELTKSLPQELSALKGFLGDSEDLKRVGGYIATQLYDTRLSMFLMVTSLMLSLTLGAGDEEQGRLRTVLSTPLSRERIILEHWTAAALLLGGINAGALIGSVIGIIAIGDTVPWSILGELTLMSWLFSVTMFSLVYAVGIGFGKRSIALTLGLLLAVGGFILTTFAVVVDWLNDWTPFSLLYYFDAKGILHNGLNLWHILVLALLTVTVIFLGMLAFRRRDVSGN